MRQHIINIFICQKNNLEETCFALFQRVSATLKADSSYLDRASFLGIWLGIRWLCIHINVRPGEMINIKEKHINRRTGIIIIEHPKEKNKTRIKTISLDSEDKELLNRTVLGMPDMYFFRHTSGKGGVQLESQYGGKYFNKWWGKACKIIGLEGVPLYPGTRHTSATALGEYCSPEQVKDATGHSSDAFNRYFLNKQARI